MLARLAILGFMAAAVATLLDRGALLDLTHDPDRRLTMAAYWALHAVLIALIMLSWRTLEREEAPKSLLALSLFAAGAFFAILFGLLVADGEALIQLVFVEAAPGVLAFIAIALVLRMFWRMFRNPQNIIVKHDEEAAEPTWRDALSTIAVVPIALITFIPYLALIGSTWRAASLVLDYAVFGHHPTTLDWRYPLDRVDWYIAHWEMFAFGGAVLVLWVVLEKLFVKTANSDQ